MVNIVAGKSEQYKRELEKDKKMVKGKFFCHEPKGGNVKFFFKKYKEIPIKEYTFADGQDYEIPLMVAKHINDCGWEVHSFLLDAQGNPAVGVGKKERRFTFQSLDFFE